MVCNRCIAAVKQLLDKHNIPVKQVQLGEAELENDQLTTEQTEDLSHALHELGFELIDDRKGRIIEKIKNIAISLVHHSDSPAKHKTSEIISSHLHYDYPYLSNLFSEVEGITIEQYIIRQKVEKIKEYIVYDDLSLSAIADKMGYSSVAHLSSQFKKVTGLTPSHFKHEGNAQRKPLDKV